MRVSRFVGVQFMHYKRSILAEIYAVQNAGKSIAKKKLIAVLSICGVLINLTILPRPLNIQGTQGTGVLLLQSVSCLRFSLENLNVI